MERPPPVPLESPAYRPPEADSPVCSPTPEPGFDQEKTLPEEPQPQAPEVSRVGRFRLERELGKGGSGTVYLAHDPRLDRHVALKIPKVDVLATDEGRRRFLREGRAAAALKHPNIVTVYEADEAAPFCYLAMEHCEGPSLAGWLREHKGSLSLRAATALVADLGLAVDHAHRKNVIHRDLKPGNVLLFPRPEPGPGDPPPDPDRPFLPKVCDFSLAKVMDGDPNRTASGEVMGTLLYMAPEQADGRAGEAGPAADVYALGVILYELLAGRRPFAAATAADALWKLRHDIPPGPRAYRREVPPDLDAVCLKCLEKAPADRYPSARALAEELLRWRAGEPTRVRPRPWPARLLRNLRRRPGRAAVCLGVLLAIAAAAFWVAPRPEPEPAHKEWTRRLADDKPVTLVGESGKPAYFRWLAGGSRGQVDTARDGSCRVQCPTVGLVEVLPDPGRDRFRIRARVRHVSAENKSGEVGIFFAYRGYELSPGTLQTFLQFAYNGVVWSMHDVPPARRPKGPDVENNLVSLEPRIWSDYERGSHVAVRAGGVEKRLARPSAMGDDWRDVTIEVGPDGVAAYWDGGVPIGDLFAANRIRKSMDAKFQEVRKSLPPIPGPDPGYCPRGAIGFYVNNGTALFQNLRVEPRD